MRSECATENAFNVENRVEVGILEHKDLPFLTMFREHRWCRAHVTVGGSRGTQRHWSILQTVKIRSVNSVRGSLALYLVFCTGLFATTCASLKPEVSVRASTGRAAAVDVTHYIASSDSNTSSKHTCPLSGLPAIGSSAAGSFLPSCWAFPDLIRLPAGPFRIRDAYPMPYLVTSTCTNITYVSATAAGCTAFDSDDSGGTPAYAMAGAGNHTCYALGHPSTAGSTTNIPAPTKAADSLAQLIDPANATAGVLVRVDGAGVGARHLQYRFVCDSSLPSTSGPLNASQTSCGNGCYEILWPTPLACAPVVLPTENCLGPDPKPTAGQLRFQERELGALVCYNMATTTGTQGCAAHNVPPVTAFTDVAPAVPDTDGWCEAIAAYGGKYATIVAKHVCGFTIWPTRARLTTNSSTNFTYTYTVPPERDILKAFAKSCSKVGVQIGIYYSVVSNEYLNVAGGKVRSDPVSKGQVSITQEQYASIVQQQLTELWTNYGELGEIWFDGGFSVPGLEQELLALLNKTQPSVPVFNGCGLSPNAVIWIGSESGHAGAPIWNTQTGCAPGTGTPAGRSYMPKEIDVTLQNADTWFYHEGRGYRSLQEMASIYEDSVGRGGNMLLNVAPPPNASIPAAAIQRYTELGSWIRRCYGVGAQPAQGSLAHTSCTSAHGSGHSGFGGRGAKGSATSGNRTDCTYIELDLGTVRHIDRVLMKEDVSNGQHVLAYEILADGKLVYNGTAIGRSQIARFGTSANISAQRVALRITSAKVAKSQVGFRLVSVPDPAACALSPQPVGQNCTLLPNTRYLGPVVAMQSGLTVQECCQACRSQTSCAFFVFESNAAASRGAAGSKVDNAFSDSIGNDDSMGLLAQRQHKKQTSQTSQQTSQCTLMSAQTGSQSDPGITSGSPKD